jgi:hypothetical protein
MEYKLNIPTVLNEITLSQYQEFDKIDFDNEAEVHLKMIEIFCGVSTLIARGMKAADVAEVCMSINNMFDTKHQLINTFKINNQEYGFIPSLEDMSFGEYVDLDTFIGDNDNLHRAMNVLYRPIETRKGERYIIESYKPDNYEVAKDFPLDAVLGSLVFFLNLGTELSTLILNSSKKTNEETLAQYLISQPNGVGTIQSMQSLKGILQNLNISLN